VVAEAIVLAGGLGTRLRSVVSDVPKAMAPVAGRPFLAYLLRFLETQGIHRVVLAVGFKNELIRAAFGSRYEGVDLVYSVEQEPLGTGGALRRALPHIEGKYTFVFNGDTFLRLDCRAMVAALDNNPQALLMVALRQVADAGRFGAAVVANGRIQGFTARGADGPGLINAGCYLVARDLFQRYPMPEKFSWEADFFQARAAEVAPVAFVCDAPFIDIGIPEALEEAQTLIPKWLATTA
jgi:D-glycero-alpha-D-manno-heptose 1-phosphate guanylyltransferase